MRSPVAAATGGMWPCLTSRDVNAFIEYAHERNPGWVDPMAGVMNPECPSFEKPPNERDPHITWRLPEDAAAAAADLSKTG